MSGSAMTPLDEFVFGWDCAANGWTADTRKRVAHWTEQMERGWLACRASQARDIEVETVRLARCPDCNAGCAALALGECKTDGSNP